MSASSTPTLRPLALKPSARLTAVVDLPTPPLPEATATIVPTPGTTPRCCIGLLCGGWAWAAGPRAGWGAARVADLVSAVSTAVTAGNPGRVATVRCAA